jgi:hypothetical protein
MFAEEREQACKPQQAAVFRLAQGPRLHESI